jgi:hypothetical protein
MRITCLPSKIPLLTNPIRKQQIQGINNDQRYNEVPEIESDSTDSISHMILITLINALPRIEAPV